MRTTRKRRFVSIEEALSRGAQTIENAHSQNYGEEISANSNSSQTKKKRFENVDDSEIPPQFRTAGLLANMFIKCGKVFGPFAGKIIPEKEPPTSKHAFICKIKDSMSRYNMYFYAEDKDKNKCNWLNMIRSPLEEQKYNCLAYNTPKGACYCAISDVNIGEELLVLYDAERSILASQKGSSKRKSKSSLSKTTAYFSNEATASNAESAGNVDDNAMAQGGDDDDDDNRPAENETTLFVPLPNNSESTDPPGVFSDDGSIKCARCNKKLKNIDQFRIHVKKCKPVTSYACSQCRHVTTSEKALLVHKKKAHSSPKRKTKNFRCTECVAVLGSKREFLKHKREKHQTPEAQIQAHECSKCDASFDSKKELRNHIQDEHPVEKQKAQSFRCTRCVAVLSSERELVKHMLRQHPIQWCKICDLKFQTHVELKKHLDEDHLSGGVHVICQICKKEFSKSYIKDHIKSHEEHAFQCSICDKNFSSPSNLKKHERKHSRGYVPKKRFEVVHKRKCEVCEKILAGSQALKDNGQLTKPAQSSAENIIDDSSKSSPRADFPNIPPRSAKDKAN